MESAPSNPNDNTPSPDDNRICFCHAVSEGDIRRAIRDGAHTLEELQSELLCSTGCGGCQSEVERILEEELATLEKT